MRRVWILLIALTLPGCISETVEDGDNETPILTVTSPEAPDTPEKIKLLVFQAYVQIVDKENPPHIVNSKDKLDFGKLPQGMTEKKDVLLTNNKDHNITVHSTANGTIAQLISFEKDIFTIQPKSNYKQVVLLKAPVNTQTGNYSGYITFYVTK